MKYLVILTVANFFVSALAQGNNGTVNILQDNNCTQAQLDICVQTLKEITQQYHTEYHCQSVIGDIQYCIRPNCIETVIQLANNSLIKDFADYCKGLENKTVTVVNCTQAEFDDCVKPMKERNLTANHCREVNEVKKCLFDLAGNCNETIEMNVSSYMVGNELFDICEEDVDNRTEIVEPPENCTQAEFDDCVKPMKERNLNASNCREVMKVKKCLFDLADNCNGTNGMNVSLYVGRNELFHICEDHNKNTTTERPETGCTDKDYEHCVEPLKFMTLHDLMQNSCSELKEVKMCLINLIGTCNDRDIIKKSHDTLEREFFRQCEDHNKNTTTERPGTRCTDIDYEHCVEPLKFMNLQDLMQNSCPEVNKVQTCLIHLVNTCKYGNITKKSLDTLGRDFFRKCEKNIYTTTSEPPETGCTEKKYKRCIEPFKSLNLEDMQINCHEVKEVKTCLINLIDTCNDGDIIEKSYDTMGRYFFRQCEENIYTTTSEPPETGCTEKEYKRCIEPFKSLNLVDMMHINCRDLKKVKSCVYDLGYSCNNNDLWEKAQNLARNIDRICQGQTRPNTTSMTFTTVKPEDHNCSEAMLMNCTKHMKEIKEKNITNTTQMCPMLKKGKACLENMKECSNMTIKKHVNESMEKMKEHHKKCEGCNKMKVMGCMHPFGEAKDMEQKCYYFKKTHNCLEGLYFGDCHNYPKDFEKHTLIFKPFLKNLKEECESRGKPKDMCSMEEFKKCKDPEDEGKDGEKTENKEGYNMGMGMMEGGKSEDDSSSEDKDEKEMKKKCSMGHAKKMCFEKMEKNCTNEVVKMLIKDSIKTMNKHLEECKEIMGCGLKRGQKCIETLVKAKNMYEKCKHLKEAKYCLKDLVYESKCDGSDKVMIETQLHNVEFMNKQCERSMGGDGDGEGPSGAESVGVMLPVLTVMSLVAMVFN